MKRDFRFLTKTQLKGINKWLKMNTLDQSNECPFGIQLYGYGEERKCISLCGRIFPRLVGRDDEYNIICPCNTYGSKYVRKVARQILKERGYKNES